MLILRLNKAGAPQEWLNVNQAVRCYAQNKVLFELGTAQQTLYGGWNAKGLQSRITVSSIIACNGKITEFGKIALNNRFLFRRDNFVCLYCGNRFKTSQLTRDHIIPRSRGGLNTWRNVATACARCNHQKGANTPEEAKMPLLAVPFEPNLYERFYLMNRKILADQMDFLSHHFSSQRNWLD